VVHAVNYRKACGIGPARIDLRAPKGWDAASATAFSPEWPESREVRVAILDGRLSMLSPEFDTYLVLHVTEADAAT
jgi:hypothetical protein